jgi:hypothetical protein
MTPHPIGFAPPRPHGPVELAPELRHLPREPAGAQPSLLALFFPGNLAPRLVK